MKKRLALSLLLAGLLTQAHAATPTGTITIVDQFQPQTTSPAATNSYRMQIGSTEGQQLTGVGFSVDLSNAYSAIQSYTSTCGGTATWNGTVVTFSGGTMAAAPDASTPTLCNITITGTTVITSGTKNIAVPVGNVVTDQGLTNASATASTLTVLPYQPLTIQNKFVQYRDGSPFNNPNLTGSITLNSSDIIYTTITNPNNGTIPQTYIKQGIPARNYFQSATYRPDLSSCTTASDLSSISAPTVDTTNGYINYSNISLSPNASCTIATYVTYNGAPDTNGSVPEGTTPILYNGDSIPISTVGSNQDAALTSQLSQSIGYSSGFGTSKWFGSGIASGTTYYNTTSDTATTFQMGIVVQNDTYYDGTYSLTDTLPNPLKATTGNVTVVTSGLYGNLNPTACENTGVSYNTTTQTLTLNNTPIKARTKCTYIVELDKSNLQSGTSRTNNIYTRSISQSNDISTLTPNESSSTIAASATVRNYPSLSAFKTSGISWFKGKVYYEVVLQNDSTTTPVQNISFNDSWTHNLLIDTSNTSLNQCGGTITINSDRKGFSFTNGTVDVAPQAGATNTCPIFIYIDPQSAYAGLYPNTINNITSSAGTITQIQHNLTINYDYSAAYPLSIPLNIPSTLRASIYNQSGLTQTRTISGTIPSTLSINPNQNVTAICTSIYSPTVLARYTLPTSQFVIQNNTLSITDTVPNNYNCNYYYTATSNTLGRITVPSNTTIDGFTYATPLRGTADNTDTYYQNGLMFNYTTVAPNTYTVNKSFNPSTIPAGTDTTLTFSLSGSGSVNDTGSANYAQITDNLPQGMIVSPANFTPNQSDGSFISPQTVGLNYPDGGQPCLQINAARTQIISRCRDTYPSILIRIIQYGDLINTLQPSDVQPFYGNVVGPASASAKATRGVPLIKSFSPTTVQSGQQTNLNISVYNAQVSGSGTNVIHFTDTLPNYLTADTTPAVSGTCAGATVSYTPATKVLTYDGIRLDPNANCTVTIPVKASTTSSSTQTATNTITANTVTSTVGGSNPQPTSATLTILPGSAQPGITKEQAVCGDASCTNPSYTQNALQVGACQYVSYRIILSNTGYSPIYTPVMRDPWPAGLTYKGASSNASNVLWQVDNNGWTSGIPINVSSGQVIRAGINSNGDTTISQADTLAPGQSVQLFLKGQAAGPSCK